MGKSNTQQVRYIAIAGYNGACKCQLLYGDDFSQQTDWQEVSNAVPMVWDLTALGLVPQDTQFQLHSDVHGQHIHSDPYVYDPDGGLLYGGIDDSQGHFSGLNVL
jgi:hypothetical protein